MKHRLTPDGREFHVIRFWMRVERGSPDECWLWTGTTRMGYGIVLFGEQSNASAHRVAYELLVGPIPEGLVLDHLCRVRNCVNPRHLEPVTQGENIRRSPLKGGLWRRDLTHCKRGHEFTLENTLTANGRRRCRACSRMRTASYRQSKREAA